MPADKESADFPAFRAKPQVTAACSTTEVAASAPRSQRPPSVWVAQVFEQLELPLLRYTGRLLQDDPERARDLVQDAFTKLCQQAWPDIQPHATATEPPDAPFKNNPLHRMRSTMNQPDRSAAWQDWHLTAYVLGELNESAAATIAAAAESDPQLAAEIADIQRTVDSVRGALESEHLGDVQRVGHQGLEQALWAAAALDTQPVSRVSVETVPHKHRRNWQRPLATSLLVLAAAIVLFIVYVQPGSDERDEALAQVLPDERTPPSSSSASVEQAEQPASPPLGEPLVEETGEPTATQLAADSEMAEFNPGLGGYGGEMGSEGMGGYGGMGGMAGGYGQGGMGAASGYGDGSGGMGMGGYGSGMEGNSDGQGGYGEGAAGMGGMGMGGGMGGMGMGMGEPSTYADRADVAYEPHRRRTEGRYHRPHDSSRYGTLVENAFQTVAEQPLSTFSIDVDTASYTKCRQLLLENNQLPPPNAVRIEEFINYFEYDYAQPAMDGDPLAANLAVSECPWRPSHKLVRIGLQAPMVDWNNRPAANLIFLLDVSGSMNQPNKLPLVKESVRMLVEQLGENDLVAMVVYAGAAGCVLESTRGNEQTKILAALDRLQAGGSTNGGDGIQLAYNIARDHYIPEGINRVILCTDGDFNVGVTGTQALVDLVVENARSKTFLTVLGYGMGNTNDDMMEQISNQGNGVYGFVDNWREAKRQMVQQLAGNLMTVAKDVKIQVEFNPQRVQAYRLVGYENRILATEDFNDDRKDAGEIGAGHRVTALYEIVPVGVNSAATRPVVDELRYQSTNSQPQQAAEKKDAEKKDAAKQTEAHGTAAAIDDEYSAELLAVKLRYKQPEGDESQLRVFPLTDGDARFDALDADFRWAAVMAEFGMLLRQSQYRGDSNWRELMNRAQNAVGEADPAREEALQMIQRAARRR